MDDDRKPPPTMEEIHEMMISSFITKITSSSRQVARLLLEANQWDVDAAVSGFTDAVSVTAGDGGRNVANPRDPRLLASRTLSSILQVGIPVSSDPPPSSPIRLRSPRSPSRARNPFSIETTQSDEQEQDHTAEESDDVDQRATNPLTSSLPRRLKFRSMSEILSVTPQVITRIVTVWRNGLTIDDNSLWTFDDPLTRDFLQNVESLESPRAVDSRDGKKRFLVKIIRRQEEDFPQQESSSPKPFQPFYGVARTLAKSDTVSTEPPAPSDSLATEPTPSTDPTAPTTTIQFVLADGTRLNSRFNTHQTIRDVRDFIDAARPDASRDYQLLIMGTFPPKPLTDLDQTIEQAGISNSVLTQKL